MCFGKLGKYSEGDLDNLYSLSAVLPASHIPLS